MLYKLSLYYHIGGLDKPHNPRCILYKPTICAMTETLHYLEVTWYFCVSVIHLVLLTNLHHYQNPRIRPLVILIFYPERTPSWANVQVVFVYLLMPQVFENLLALLWIKSLKICCWCRLVQVVLTFNCILDI